MISQKKMQWVVHQMSEMLSCSEDGTRLRFGDYECPHCGADVANILEEWAGRLLIGLTKEPLDDS
jgi:hypothetical protein